MDMFIDKHGFKEGSQNEGRSTSKEGAKICDHSFVLFFLFFLNKGDTHMHKKNTFLHVFFITQKLFYNKRAVCIGPCEQMFLKRARAILQEFSEIYMFFR